MSSTEWTPKKCKLDVSTRILRDGQGRRRQEFHLYPDVYTDIQKRRSLQNPAKDVVQKYTIDAHAMAEMKNLGIWPPPDNSDQAWAPIDRWMRENRSALCRTERKIYFPGIGEGEK